MRYLRAFVPGGCYFFTVVTWRRLPVFAEADRVEVLREAFRSVKKKRPFEVDAMVILPDHLHCIWQLPEGDTNYSGRWEMIKKVCNRMVSASSDKPVQLWQRRFWEHVIRDEKDWRNHMDYIHFNPVKHGLTSCAAEWPYSSFASAVAKGWYDPTWGESEPDSIASINLE